MDWDIQNLEALSAIVHAASNEVSPAIQILNIAHATWSKWWITVRFVGPYKVTNSRLRCYLQSIAASSHKEQFGILMT